RQPIDEWVGTRTEMFDHLPQGGIALFSRASAVSQVAVAIRNRMVNLAATLPSLIRTRAFEDVIRSCMDVVGGTRFKKAGGTGEQDIRATAILIDTIVTQEIMQAVQQHPCGSLEREMLDTDAVIPF